MNRAVPNENEFQSSSQLKLNFRLKSADNSKLILTKRSRSKNFYLKSDVFTRVVKVVKILYKVFGILVTGIVFRS